jgi:hypothetical protein
LFIGSSRVPATINAELIMQMEPGKTAVVAGRGYATAGIHYQALRHKLKKYPGYLEGATVFMEFPGSGYYTDPFSDNEMLVYEPDGPVKLATPHVILPYLDFSELIEFFRVSKNSLGLKIKMGFLYALSFYRTVPFVKEEIQKYDKSLVEEEETLLVDEGGIRNDVLDLSRDLAIEWAQKDSLEIEQHPSLTFELLEESSIAHLYRIVTEHGGKFVLYRVPLHTIQDRVHQSAKARANKKVYERWLSMKGIRVLDMKDFAYNDGDFPDTWHLGKDKRDEFTELLLREITQVHAQKTPDTGTDHPAH